MVWRVFFARLITGVPTMGSRFIIVDTYGPGLDELGDPYENSMEAFEAYRDVVLQDAKENAPWEDRTGNAREGLEAVVDGEGDTVVLTLYHTVEYGIFLETAMNGDYAIILPTLEKWGMDVYSAAGFMATGIGGIGRL